MVLFRIMACRHQTGVIWCGSAPKHWSRTRTAQGFRSRAPSGAVFFWFVPRHFLGRSCASPRRNLGVSGANSLFCGGGAFWCRGNVTFVFTSSSWWTGDTPYDRSYRKPVLKATLNEDNSSLVLNATPTAQSPAIGTGTKEVSLSLSWGSSIRCALCVK